MKRKLVLLLTVTMLVLTVAGCGNKDANEGAAGSETTENAGANDTADDAQTDVSAGDNAADDTQTDNAADTAATEEPAAGAVSGEITNSADVLNNVWNTFAEDEKFAAMGGDFANAVDGMAGIFNIEDTENLTYMLYIPTDNVAMIDEAASLLHAMNANTFTGAAFHLTDAANAEAFTDAMKDNIMNTQWMCGFPDKMMIVTVNGEYVVSAFGNAEIMDNFKSKLTEVYGDAAVIVAEENIV